MTIGGTAAIALIDTNVLVYAYDPRDVAKGERARDILKQLCEGGGALSVQVLGEFYWTVRRSLKPPLAAQEASIQIEILLHSWQIFPLTTGIVAEAVRGAQRYQFPYWDALIWATAKLHDVPHVLSEDSTTAR